MRQTLRERLTARVLLLSATVAVLLGTALGLLIVTVAGQRGAAREALRSQEALTTASLLQGSLVRIENGVRGFAASGRERFLGPAGEALERYPRQLARLDELVAEEPLQRRSLADLETGIEDYVNLWARPLIVLARKEPASAQSSLVTGIGRGRLAEIDGALEELAALKREVVRDNAGRADRASTLAIGFGIGGLGLVLVVAGGVAVYLGRSVVRPVRDVARATGRLAGGDLSTRVPAQREDELGDLARSFNQMADRLQVNRGELATRTEQLEHSNAELMRSNRELEQFASVTSHDLQAPLVTVAMYAELLERRHAAQLGKDLELVDGIRGATDQARTLIRDLLDYSRAGREEPSLAAVHAATVVEQALESLAGAVEAAGARVRVEGPLPVVLADAAGLTRVMANLVGNAVKFVDGRAPEVTIGAQREGTWWRLWVRDNGIGMDPAHAGRIFEPFQRLNGEEHYAGTGLGLAVCERIVERHGGRIWVDSAPGEGSTFSFTLPPAAIAHTSEPTVVSSR
ncbi:MAG: CHASE3 domain-containing protein [Solirubrobacterales bacterium]|nr:CHASE3 domain-containing protein [Solirubrobacterales bacterium]